MLKRAITTRRVDLFNLSVIGLVFILGLWLVVIRPLGLHFTFVPGDLGDARFNNYVLENFYRWVTGLNRDYWNAPFFYPFPMTMAFSDNLLGSAPFYAFFRWVGFDFTSAFQAWYILGYCLNFAAAGYVLSRLGLKPLAVAAGAFFFTFGLPLLAQENHAQLLYRFGVPLGCYFLWMFYQEPRLIKLVALALCLVWQFFLTIYIGIFLSLLLAVLVVVLPFCFRVRTIWKRILLGPQRLIQAWNAARLPEKVLEMGAILVLGLSLLALLWPYYKTSRIYGFSRDWDTVSIMLPRPQSYLLADNSQIWSSISKLVPDPVAPHEHQLFPGIAAAGLLILGMVGRFDTPNRRIAWAHFAAMLVLVGLTLDIHGFSLYRFIWQIPGMNSLRAVTRIQLVLMWPLALFMAWVFDALIRWLGSKPYWTMSLVYLIAALLISESVFYHHTRYSIPVSQARLDKLRQQIPVSLPKNPILFFKNGANPFWAVEIDAMLVSQEMGMPTMNGYSGNNPPGHTYTRNCSQLPQFIKDYMDFANISDPQFYTEIMKRAVPIGFSDCDPSWWNKMP
ncbi:MAG: hypothetical protein M1281_20460 [Chloroflexi bacterium]|nr:hypothetical protein [Chloroflexota bacterium]